MPADSHQPDASDETVDAPGVEQLDLSANGDIAADLKCTQCGYNLRGLTLDQRCPECWTPIARSIHGDLLRYADADWVDRLRFGTSLMLWQILATVVIMVGAFVVTVSVGPMAVFSVLIGLVPRGLKLGAVFSLTSPEPAVEFDEDPLTLRRGIRLCAFGGVVGGIVIDVSLEASLPLVIQIVGGALMLIGLVADMGIFIYLRRFAIRLPNERLARQTRTVMWGYIITMALIIICISIEAIFAGGTAAAGAATPTTAGAVLCCPAALGAVVFFVWWVVLLFDYKNSFAANAQTARAMAEGQVPDLSDNAGEGDTGANNQS